MLHAAAADMNIDLARSLSRECDLPARFICCDLYDLPQHLDETFDIAFETGKRAKLGQAGNCAFHKLSNAIFINAALPGIIL